jgi:hypothetical protein
MKDNTGFRSNELDHTDPLAVQRVAVHQQNLPRTDPVAKPDDFNNKVGGVIASLGSDFERNAPLSQPAGAPYPTPESTRRLVDYVRAETIEGNKSEFDY